MDGMRLSTRMSASVAAVLLAAAIAMWSCWCEDCPVCSDDSPDSGCVTQPTGDILCSFTSASVEGLRIVIESPVERASLPRETSASGTVEGLPAGYTLRVFVRAPSGQWWPQQFPVVTGQRWEADQVYLGDAADAGKTFRIGVLAISPDVAQAIGTDLSGRTRFQISGEFHAQVPVTRI